jgi:hypothetical protein
VRLRMTTTKNVSAADLSSIEPLLTGTKGPIVLELDYWVLLPRR